MATHKATIRWRRSGDGADFSRGRFSREHTWSFDGGVTVMASAAPSVVPAPWSNPAGVDPEEAFVAALSSCHMMTFVWLASKAGYEIESYDDDAVGTLTKNDKGVPWVSSVVLHPRIVWSGDKRPHPVEEHALHERAHEQCFISQSVKSDVTVAAAET